VYKDIHFDESTCGNVKVALEKEWLEADGGGGYSSSTIIGVNTRTYHGLLVAPPEKGTARILFLSKFEELIVIDGKSHSLSCNIYPDAIHPTGFMYLKEFSLSEFPTFVYQIGDVVIEKKIFMIRGEHSVVVMYRLLEGTAEVTLKIRPLVAFRSYHKLLRHSVDVQETYSVGDHEVVFRLFDTAPFLYFKHNGFLVERASLWYYNFIYAREAERGFGASEDLFNPFEITYRVTKNQPACCITSLQQVRHACGISLEQEEHAKRKALFQSYGVPDTQDVRPTAHTIGYRYVLNATSAFIVKRDHDSSAIVAGYPWFEEWGRDTMIALTGLTLVTRRFDCARSILKRYVSYLKDGRLPNYFSEETGLPVYNAVDSALWYFYAIYKYIAYTGDLYFVIDELYDTMKTIVYWLIQGADPHLKMADDYLLTYHGKQSPGTWMDARIGDRIITPRRGKIVEINALWFNAIKVLECISHRCKEDKDNEKFKHLAEQIQAHFTAVFWNKEKHCLYDSVEGSEKNDTLRPNQIFAVSIPFQLMNFRYEQSIVESVEHELLTMHGLRSLSALSENYCGTYTGNPYSRDSSYHQGTVWPWLIGPFIDAYIKVNGRKGKSREVCEVLIKALFHHVLYDAGLGFVSEIFDGDFPHAARGCSAQAWSVAELVRIYHEYILAAEPHLSVMPSSL